MLLKNKLVVLLLLLLLVGCSNYNLTPVEYNEVGTVESIGFKENLVSNRKIKIAVIDVIPSNDILPYIHKIETYGYKLKKESTHSNQIISVLSNYIPINSEIDLYCVGEDYIEVSTLKKALKDIKGISYDVINMSFILSERDNQIESLINEIQQKGSLLVAAAGNHNLPYSEFPASIPSVISVGGINEYGMLWENSNFKKIDYVMPTISENIEGSGTSISAAYMTAFLSQLYLFEPELDNKTSSDVIEILNKKYLNSDIDELMGQGQPTFR